MATGEVKAEVKAEVREELEVGSKRKSVEYSDIKLFEDGSDQPPRKKIATAAENGISAVVAQHYNNVEEKGKAARTESRIFYMRNFNNWIKSNLIAEFLEKVRGKKEPISVLDLGCGKGGDLLKWKKGEISKLVGVDVADVSVQQARERYQTLQKQQGSRGDHHQHQQQQHRVESIFKAEFHCFDCCSESILDHVEDKDLRFDLTSCQFVYNYSFNTYPRAEAMLANACRYLKTGGFFIGTMPNANEIMKRLKMSDSGDEFGNDVFRVRMTSPVNWPQGGRFVAAPSNGDAASSSAPPPGVVPIFGAEYNFSLESVVDCPEYLVHFGTFKKMAEKHGMKLVYAKRFPDYAKQVLEFDPQSRALMQRMSALESFPAEGEKKLVGTDSFDYAHADDHVKALLAKFADKEGGAAEIKAESAANDAANGSSQASTSSDAAASAVSNGASASSSSSSSKDPSTTTNIGDGSGGGGGDGGEAKRKEDSRYSKIKVGTLSKSEWDAVTLYMVFAFQKITEPA